ncbi:MAG: helix-turn-helix domain-containing protein [Chloroflexota bacterium]|nr:helix-turn-helix domain-containing protein [Chloroflexota bacterium]
MAGEWLTLPEAARQLGVSARTVRRWIHDGKLHAELRPGPYGQQYLVPLQALPAARMLRSTQLPQPPVAAGLDALRHELLEELRRQEERQRELLEELVEEVVRLRGDVQQLTARLTGEGVAE